MRQAPNRNPAARGEYGPLGGSPRQQAPRQQTIRQRGVHQPSPRRETSRTAAAGEGGSRLLIGVIVALIAACLPIFVFLGYKLLSRAPAVAKAPADAASSDTPSTSANSSSTGELQNAELPPKPEQAPAVQPANLPSSTSTPNSSFTPPTVASPSPSVSPSQPPPVAFQPAPSANEPASPPAAGAPTTGAPTNPAPAAPASPPGNTSGGSSFGSGAATGGNSAISTSPRPGVLGSTREVVQVVEPSVVVVEVPNVGLGSGFVIDSRGIIATNYHVIEGAKNATVTFLTDKAKFDVTGFLVISPGKDLAILKIEPHDRVLKALPMAETPPDKGEAVLAFGAPKGFGGSVSDGIVSSVRNGSELSEMLGQGGRVNIYKDLLGYDLDAVWIQTTAPISGGNSGGPLVNMRGEVVGLNTWNRTDGQNLNFAISAEHVRKIMQSVPSGPRALAELPAPRKQHGGGDGTGAPGDPQRTLAYWEQVGEINRSMYKRVKKIARPPLPVGGKNKNAFYAKMAAYYRKLAEILPDHAARLKDIDVKDVDVELVALVTADAMIMEGFAEELRSMALTAELKRGVRVFDTEQIAKKSYSSGGRSIAQAFDIMRINFNLKYGLNFPSIAGAASPSKSATDDAEDDDEDKSKSKAKADDKPDDPEKASERKLKLAKQMLKDPRTRDAGIEKLEKIVADYPNTAAAEEAKKLLKQFAPEKKSQRGGLR